ncbi:MAG: hypothetical protein Q7R48_02855 [bacterium]|nr:hypothetical protein [bacterium]
MKKRKNKQVDNQSSQSKLERRLEALIVLFAGLLSQEKNATSERAKEKAATLLLEGGISQDNVAFLLGINRNKVTKISKK